MSRSANGTTLSRQQILDITTRCLHEQGYDATTIRRIAGMLDCAVGSIYRYFEDKRDLLYAVTEQRLEPVVAMLEAGATFEASVAAYVRRANDDGEAYRMMFWLAAVIDRGNKNEADADEAFTPYDGDAVDGQGAQASSLASTDRGLGGDPVATTPLPQVVERVISGWATVLGDQGVARACWAMLHGSMMLGLPADQIVEATLAYASAASPRAQRVADDAHASTSPIATIGRTAPAAPVTLPASTAGRTPSRPVVEGDADFRSISGRPRAAMTRLGEMPVPAAEDEDQAIDEATAQAVQTIHERHAVHAGAESQAPMEQPRSRAMDDVTLL